MAQAQEASKKGAKEASNGVVLVTGGNGFIGQALCRELAADYKVVALDVKEPRAKTSEYHFIPMDVSSDKSVQDAFGRIRQEFGDRIASVVHLAAYYSFSGDPSPLYDQITVQGTRRLFEQLRNFSCEQFIFSSTMLVHQPAKPGHKVNEESPLAPKWDYPRSKVDAEKIIREKHGAIPYVSLRIAGVYDDRGHSIPIANEIQRVYEHQLSSHFYPAPLDRGQSFVHLDDLVDAIHRTIDRRSQLPNELALLIGEPETLSYGRLQDRIGCMLFKKHWKTMRVPKTFAKAGATLQGMVPGSHPFIKPFMIDLASDHYELDISRARRLLGWKPHHRLAKTLPRIIATLRRDPRAWYEQNKLEYPSQMEAMLRSASTKFVPFSLVIAGIAGAIFAWRRRERIATLRV